MLAGADGPRHGLKQLRPWAQHGCDCCLHATLLAGPASAITDYNDQAVPLAVMPTQQ